MKLLKKRILLTVWFGLFSGFLMFANAQPSLETQADNRAKRMTKQLGLSEEQTAKVSAVFLEVLTKQAEIKQSNMEPAERKKAMREVSQTREKGLKETLSEEQWGKLQEIRKKQRERQQARKQQQQM